MQKHSPADYLEDLKKEFEIQGDPERAQGQMAYMRHQFEYYGLRAPEWTAIVKAYYREHGIFSGEELKDFVVLCYNEDHREIHYASIEMVQMAQKKKDPELTGLLEWIITHHSWWDTVDWVSKLVGIQFRHFPDQINPVTERWIYGKHLWLQRAAIIFQLLYRDKTDQDLLFRYILHVKDSKEFFLQKAAGWALRNYSRVNPDAVIEFTAQNQLAPLTRREALRLIYPKKVKP
ncbi:MAG: DNA alkylation repair protein [Saprospiraceae bacterium]|nr:DNA alkylation repair protein [Saprospiraceae bacterium]